MARLLGRSRPIEARQELDKAIELDSKLAEAYALRSLLPNASVKERREDAERSKGAVDAPQEHVASSFVEQPGAFAVHAQPHVLPLRVADCSSSVRRSRSR